MNKSALKNFAVRARKRLIEEVTQKAYEAGITKDKIHNIETFEGGFKVKDRENGKVFKKYEAKQRKKLLEKINEKGFDQVMEEVAYTWFNRFIALRFMEINNYLPTEVRVLSSLQPGKKEPDIIREALNIDLDVDREIVFRLQDSGDTEDLYKYLLIRQCNQLGEIMPAVFEQIEDYTELLLPDNLLAEGSVIRDLVDGIDEYDWKIELSDAEQGMEAEKGEHGIEIIGWLYQYYISEKKDEVFAGLKKNIKITKENIPAATQLFTPKWIVKYMVENSLGRLWLESHPDKDLQAKWKYYLEEAEQEPEVQKQLEELKNPNLNPEEIKILDPAMGSGHILVYAFDVLYDIYLRAGYPERQIPGLILEKNLYGLEIDDRAGQLASFALLMKARSKNRRIFRHVPRLNLCSIQESNGIPRKAVDYLVGSKETGIVEYMRREEVEYLIDVFHDAKEYGSILEVKEIDFDALEQRVEEIRKTAPEDIFEYMYLDRDVILEKLPPLIKQGRIMSQKYDVVCTNPPYMGRRGMNSNLVKYTDNNYYDSGNDLFAVFIEKGLNYLNVHGFNSMVTMQSWMFLASFESLRKKILDNYYIATLLHMENMVMGIAFGTSATIARKTKIHKYLGTFTLVTLKDLNKRINEPNVFPIADFTFKQNTSDFFLIPGNPIVYWISNTVKGIFKGCTSLRELCSICKGIDTGNNDRFLKLWFEVNFHDIGLNFNSYKSAISSECRYYPYNKGGAFRKWFGNNEYVLYWNKNGDLLRNSSNSNLRNKQFYRQEGLTWSTVTSASFSIRYFPNGFYFDNGGCCLFSENKLFFLALLNSIVFSITERINPTINYQPGYIGKMPVILPDNDNIQISLLSQHNIDISKTDWDSFETSWDFQKHPLLNP
ncbi:MAG: BREX-1 system adenine-specific DNA-methyltransferase PglX [Dethiobacteria bacterium]